MPIRKGSPRSPQSRVLVFGTFDRLHPGHRSFLRQAKRLGSELIVAIGRDAVVRRLKRRPPLQAEAERCQQVDALPFVDRAVLAPANPAQRFRFIKRLAPDILALGYDQVHYTEQLAAELKQRSIRCRIVRLKPFHPKSYKSSLLRPALVRRSASSPNQA